MDSRIERKLTEGNVQGLVNMMIGGVGGSLLGPEFARPVKEEEEKMEGDWHKCKGCGGKMHKDHKYCASCGGKR